MVLYTVYCTKTFGASIISCCDLSIKLAAKLILDFENVTASILNKSNQNSLDSRIATLVLGLARV